MFRCTCNAILAAFVPFIMTGCATFRDSSNASEAAIRNADAAWSRAAGERGLDGFLSYYAPDAKLLVPNHPLASGIPAIRELLRPMFEATGFSLSWKPVHVEAARSGELGYVHGTYQLSLKDATGAPHNDRGKYLEIWKKQSDGQWKCIVDTFTTDMPLAGH